MGEMVHISQGTKRQVMEAFRAVERVKFGIMQYVCNSETVAMWTNAYDQFRQAEKDWLNGKSTG